ncbi:MAG: PKD domain-containing protein [Desulfuromonadaceae bacterium]|nr:PKD domain-containing protein [Desulfuromonadaceae bacterium]
MINIPWHAIISAAMLLFLLFCPVAWAGIIDPDSTNSHSAWGENVGWIDLKPSFDTGVTVTDSGLSGNAWGENIGWISLSPTNGLGGVLNNGSGTLSGTAWGENVGWINFGGVSIDACGDFKGSAWGENIGWISFRSDGANPFRVRTDWTSPTVPDDIAPITTYAPALQPWYRNDVNMILTATDCGKGVKEIRYQIGNGSEVIQPGTMAKPYFNTEGCRSLSFHAVDKAVPANIEATQTLNICIDKTPPVITLATPANFGTYYINTTATPSYTVTDAVSGVSGTGTSGIFSTSSIGSNSYTVSATDNAGNQATVTHSYTVAFPGNMDPGDAGCQYAWAENMGWINFKPSWGPGVTVIDSAVTGMVWGENIGWINLGNPDTGFVGVTNNGRGVLSGSAWSENIGWINFKPNQGPGVTIGADGKLSGQAWGENIGWINFSGANSCVKTAWVPPDLPPVASGQTVTLNEDSPAAITLAASDPEGNPVSYTVLTQPQHGTLTGTPPNLTYTPQANYNGPDNFTFKASDGQLDSNVATVTITVNPVNDPPVVNAGAASSVTEGSQFSGSGSFTDPDPDTWTATVNYGDGSGISSLTLKPDKSFDLSHNYAEVGSYQLTVSVTDSANETNSASRLITVVNAVPVITGIQKPTTVNEGSTVTLTANFTDAGILDSHTTLWNWGGGTTSGTVSEANGSGTATVTHVYPDNGTYQAMLALTDNHDGIATEYVALTVANLPPVVGAITGYTAPVEAGIQLNLAAGFTDAGVNDSHLASWDWGDTTSAPGIVTEANGSGTATSSYTYATPGTYTAILTVTDKDGATGSSTISITVLPANQPPQADAGGDRIIYNGDKIALQGSATDPDNDTISSWAWTVVDYPVGSSYTLYDETSQTAQFIANSSGKYILSLVATDSRGNASAYDYVTVDVAVNLPPVAVATADYSSGTAPLAVCFDGSQSSDPENGSLTYSWNLGNAGATGTEATICHTYLTPGEYTVSLMVTDPLNSSDTELLTITVQAPNNPPVINPTATPVAGAAPLEVQFAANATDIEGQLLIYSWDFGDGATSSVSNPEHIYTQAGSYTARITVSDGADSTTTTTIITVSPTIELNVTKADIDFKSKKSLLADVEIQAELYASLPAPDDMIAFFIDGTEVFAVPFREFSVVDHNAYRYKNQNLWVKIDFDKGRLSVNAEKVMLTGYNPRNGVDVNMMIGNAVAADNIQPKDDKDDRHYKHHRPERGKGFLEKDTE